MLISELKHEERTSIRAYIETLPKWFRQCECYLKDYDAGEQTVLKLLQVVKETRALIDDTINELIEKHRLPNDLKEIDAELVSTIRNMVAKAKR